MGSEAGRAAVAENKNALAVLPGCVDRVGQPADLRRIEPIQLGLEPFQVVVHLKMHAQHSGAPFKQRVESVCGGNREL